MIADAVKTPITVHIDLEMTLGLTRRLRSASASASASRLPTRVDATFPQAPARLGSSARLAKVGLWSAARQLRAFGSLICGTRITRLHAGHGACLPANCASSLTFSMQLGHSNSISSGGAAT